MNEEKNLTTEETFALAVQNHEKSNFKNAEILYRKILNINPDHFRAIFLLGTLSAQTKNLDSAKQLLQKAIQINPKHAEAHNNLGNVLIELKEFEKAKNCYEKAIQINPNFASAHNNLGAVFNKLREFQQAISCYEKAIEIQPKHAEAHNNLGTVLNELGEYKKAISFYHKAIEMKPNHAEAYNNLGIVLKELGEYKKAISCYEKAIEIKPDYVTAHYNLGIVLKGLGMFEKAISCYEKAIKYQSENLVYFYHLSELKKEILSSDLKNKIVEIMNSDKCTKKNLAYGNFLLSIYELKEKKYEKEFNYLLKGHLHYFDSEKEKFKKDVDYRLNTLPNINKLISLNKSNKNNHKINPIFIIGVPRCGSTLVEKVIASGARHIPMGEETSILDKFIKQEIQKRQLLNLEKENFQIKLLEMYKQKGLIQENTDYTFTDKSLENFFYIGVIKEIFPSAKIINCKRNALSSIMSILQNNLISLGWAHNLDHIFKYFDIYYRIIEHFKKNFPNFIYELEYEKFVNEPEIESKKLMSFCNLPWDKKCLEFYKRKDFISKTASNVQIREAIYKRSLDKYLPYKIFLDNYGNKYSWFN
tara:strand:- start:18 stop:1781 length:1764 start_codon:yes stop_codon:yes gene_type:complete